MAILKKLGRRIGRWLHPDIGDKLDHLIRKVEAMARTLDETIAAVEAANTKQDSLIALFKGLKQQLADILSGATLPPGVQAKVDSLFNSVEAQAGEVSAAIDENTPPSP